MSNLAQGFLHDHRRIEAWLRKRAAAADKRAGFATLLDRQARQHRFLGQCADRLRALNDLRNAMVHTVGRRERLIAEPVASVAEELRRIADRLEAPPPLPRHLLREIARFDAGSALRPALEFMHAHGYSQVPVVADAQVLGVLTLETVTRWLAVAAGDGSVDIDAAPLRLVLAHQERDDHYAFMPSQSHCEAVLDRFVEARERGVPLTVLLTDSGRADATIRGLIAASDVPVLAAALMGD